MPAPGRLVVYVTSHGFGHLNRTVAVLNRLPFEVPVTIRSDPNLFSHWRERLQRPADLEPYNSDAGAVNPPGDSAATDGPATIARAMARHAEAVGRLDEEVERLRGLEAAAVLVDVPPLPLVAARRAGVPGYALANFTWAEIYHEHAEAAGPEALAFVQELRRCYAQATAAFRAEPGLRLAEFAHKIEVGMVTTPGRDRGEELRQLLGLEPRAKVAYIYFGRYGQENLGWENLARLRDVHFVGFHPAPVGPIPNLHVVPPGDWTGTDLMASADVALAKAGYGSVCEAMVSGTPLLYPHRSGFAEHAVLDQALRTWGGGIALSDDQFTSLDVGPVLERAFRLRVGSPPFYAGGAARVADHLHAVCLGNVPAPG